MATGTRFQAILKSEHNDVSAKTVILCSGKHYYTLLEHLTKSAQGLSQIALVRIEELSPFPRHELAGALWKYGDAEMVWAQEEPKNQGSWSYVQPRLEAVLRGLGRDGSIRYAGRKSGATVATGVGAWHKAEMAEILRDALRA